MTTEMPGLGAILEAQGSDREVARTAPGPFRLALRETGPVTEAVQEIGAYSVPFQSLAPLPCVMQSPGATNAVSVGHLSR